MEKIKHTKNTKHYYFFEKTHFLYLLGSTVPEIFLQMQQFLLPMFKELPTNDAILDAFFSWPRYHKNAIHESDLAPGFAAFIKELEAFTEKFNLKAKWIEEQFVKVLEWQVDGYVAMKGDELAIGFHTRSDESDRFSFTFEVPRAGLSKREYRERLLKQLDKEFEEYYEDWSVKRGTRNSAYVKQIRHISWFILYQVKELTYREIVELDQSEKSVDESTVEKAVKQFSVILDLPLREPSKRGRKIKT